MLSDTPWWAQRLLRFLKPALDLASSARLRWRISGFAAIVAISVADRAAGSYVALTALYLVPVVVIAWVSTFRTAISAALLAAVAQTLAENLKGAGSGAVMAWNGVARLAVYLFAALALLLLRMELEEERETARVDALTGVANRRGFREAAIRELAEAERDGRALGVAFVDLDGLKAINDTYGHQVGDRAITAVARHLVSAVRVSDVVGRLGGDEFAILLAAGSSVDTEQVVARLGGRVECAVTDLETVSAGKTSPASVVVPFSIGVTTCRPDDGAPRRTPTETVDALLSAADQVMYAAKRAHHAPASIVQG